MSVFFIVLIHSYFRKKKVKGTNGYITINKYVQQNVQKALQFVMLSAIDDKMEKLLSTEYWQFLILYLSGRCCWVYTTMEMTSNLWSVAKPETFHSLSLTTGLDCLLFNSPRVAFYLEKAPSGALKSRRTPGMPFLREDYEGCREERNKRKSQSGCGMCQRQDIAKPFAVRAGWHTHTNRRLQVLKRIVHVIVLSDTLLTAGTQADRDCSSLWKQINQPFLHKHSRLHALIQQRKTCCEDKADRLMMDRY